MSEVMQRTISSMIDKPTIQPRRAKLLFCLFAICAFGCSNDTPVVPKSNQIPSRIVSLAPNLTEIIYLLGEQDRLVGVSPYCKFPPEAAEKPKVGALVNMDYEQLRSLDPDLVIMLPGQNEVAQKIERLGIQSKIFRSDSLDDIYVMIEGLGEVLGKKDIAKSEITRLKSELDSLRAETAARVTSPPRVLLVIGRNPGTLQQLYACGSGNFLDSLLNAVGAENVLKDTTVPWPIINKESIVQYDPDVILDASLFQGDTPADQDSHMKAWEQLDMLRAVKEGRVVSIRDDHLLVVGPWFVNGARILADAIYGSQESVAIAQ